MKKIIALSMLAVSLVLTAGCTKKEETAAVKAETAVSEDTKYGACNLSLSQEEFEKLGFTLGDSCDIEFSNGYSITDVPYYNGYYVKNAYPVIVAYPGSSNVSITYNNAGIWSTAELKDGDSVVITLKEAGKYSAVQDSLGQVYSFDREKYESDEQFCNFRTLTGGNLKENFLYRGASPVDNSRGRAAYANGLLEQNGIQFVLDLADSEEDLNKYAAADDFVSEYTKGLYAKGQDALLSMGSAYQSEVYMQKLASGLKQMIEHEGPVYIHCMEGKDRTGFVCMLMEALAGADYEEMRRDYMITYKNYYGVTPDGTPDKYDAITELYFDAFVSFLHGTEDPEELKKADYTEDAENYLMEGGMTAEEIAKVKEMITK